MRPTDQALLQTEMELIKRVEHHRTAMQQNVLGTEKQCRADRHGWHSFAHRSFTHRVMLVCSSEFGSNPLQYAIEFLALGEGEIDGWAKVFEKLDKQRDGFITVDDLIRCVRMVRCRTVGIRSIRAHSHRTHCFLAAVAQVHPRSVRYG